MVRARVVWVGMVAMVLRYWKVMSRRKRVRRRRWRRRDSGVGAADLGRKVRMRKRRAAMAVSCQSEWRRVQPRCMVVVE